MEFHGKTCEIFHEDRVTSWSLHEVFIRFHGMKIPLNTSHGVFIENFTCDFPHGIPSVIKPGRYSAGSPYGVHVYATMCMWWKKRKPLARVTRWPVTCRYRRHQLFHNTSYVVYNTNRRAIFTPSLHLHGENYSHVTFGSQRRSAQCQYYATHHQRGRLLSDAAVRPSVWPSVCLMFLAQNSTF